MTVRKPKRKPSRKAPGKLPRAPKHGSKGTIVIVTLPLTGGRGAKRK